MIHYSERLGRISSYVPPRNSDSKLCRKPSSDKCSFDFRNETPPTQSVQVTALPGLESFWTLVMRGYHGTIHRMSLERLVLNVKGFAIRHNRWDLDTLRQYSIWPPLLVPSAD